MYVGLEPNLFWLRQGEYLGWGIVVFSNDTTLNKLFCIASPQTIVLGLKLPSSHFTFCCIEKIVCAHAASATSKCTSQMVVEFLMAVA